MFLDGEDKACAVGGLRSSFNGWIIKNSKLYEKRTPSKSRFLVTFKWLLSPWLCFNLLTQLSVLSLSIFTHTSHAIKNPRNIRIVHLLDEVWGLKSFLLSVFETVAWRIFLIFLFSWRREVNKPEMILNLFCRLVQTKHDSDLWTSAREPGKIKYHLKGMFWCWYKWDSFSFDILPGLCLKCSYFLIRLAPNWFRLPNLLTSLV